MVCEFRQIISSRSLSEYSVEVENRFEHSAAVRQIHMTRSLPVRAALNPDQGRYPFTGTLLRHRPAMLKAPRSCFVEAGHSGPAMPTRKPWSEASIKSQKGR